MWNCSLICVNRNLIPQVDDSSGRGPFPNSCNSSTGRFLPHWPYSQNNYYKLFRSASTMKVIQYYGILDKVVKTIDGSTSTTEHLVYDEITRSSSDQELE